LSVKLDKESVWAKFAYSDTTRKTHDVDKSLSNKYSEREQENHHDSICICGMKALLNLEVKPDEKNYKGGGNFI